MHETCDITDHTWALAYLLQATGDAHYADRIEQVIFNALPGSITKDFHALQYFSCPNQVIAYQHFEPQPVHARPELDELPPGPRSAVLPRQPAPRDAQLHLEDVDAHRRWRDRGGAVWPRRTANHRRSRRRRRSRSLPRRVIPSNNPSNSRSSRRSPYPSRFRAHSGLVHAGPGWRSTGRRSKPDLQPGSFFTIERLWQPGDRVRLDLPFELALDHWPGGGVSLTYGPLTLALPIPSAGRNRNPKFHHPPTPEYPGRSI